MSPGRRLHVGPALRRLSEIAQGSPLAPRCRGLPRASVMVSEHLPRMCHWPALTSPWQLPPTLLFRGALSTCGTLAAACLLSEVRSKPFRGAAQGVAWAGLRDVVQPSAPYTLLRLRSTCRTKPEGTFAGGGMGSGACVCSQTSY